MRNISPKQIVYAPGFPALLDKLRELPEPCEPGLPLALYGLLRAAGMKTGYAECDVLSGQAVKFLYAREHPECAMLSFVPPVDTLFRALDVTWKEVTPSDPVTAFALAKEWIASGKISLARFSEPMLVVGFREDAYEISLVVARVASRLKEEILTIAECEKLYWRYPLDEANMLIHIEDILDREPNYLALIKVAARRAAAQWKSPLAGCDAGIAAYQAFARDLRDMSVDFTQGARRQWTGSALWMQWTARTSAGHFFERMAPRFGGKERHALSKAGFYYVQCADAWMKFAELLGPTWNSSQIGFRADPPKDFWMRWRSARLAAAQWVEEAGGWEGKAVSELVTLFG